MRLSSCCGKKESEILEEVFNKVGDLNDLQKSIVKRRYISALTNLSKRSSRYSLMFHLGHFIITVGSLIVPALMSVQYSNAGMEDTDDIDTFQTNVYWITWFISVMVTTCNGVLTLFKIDKKYFFLHTFTEKLRSEGWQFLSLSGRYIGLEYPSTHANQFVEFCRQVEKIKLKQADEEYYKQEEKTKQEDNPKNKGTSSNAAYTSIMQSSAQLIPSPLETNRSIDPIINQVINAIKNDAKQKTDDITEGVRINVNRNPELFKSRFDGEEIIRQKKENEEQL